MIKVTNDITRRQRQRISPIFLHAILTPVSEWSDLFYICFKRVQKFVENENFSESENNEVVQALLRDSYYPTLLMYLDLLNALYLDHKNPQEQRRPQFED